MKIRFSEDLIKELRIIKKQDPKLFKIIEKQLNIFKDIPNHNSLRTHKLSGKLGNMWSISINMSIRMVYLRTKEDEAYFVDIGTHYQIYK